MSPNTDGLLKSWSVHECVVINTQQELQELIDQHNDNCLMMKGESVMLLLKDNYAAGREKGMAFINRNDGHWQEEVLTILEDEAKLVLQDNLSAYQNGYAEGTLHAISQQQQRQRKLSNPPSGPEVRT